MHYFLFTKQEIYIIQQHTPQHRYARFKPLYFPALVVCKYEFKKKYNNFPANSIKIVQTEYLGTTHDFQKKGNEGFCP